MKLRGIFSWFGGHLREAVAINSRVARAKAVESIEIELEELEKIFALLTMGSLVGLPSPPTRISLELMPLMEHELITMIEGIDTAHEPISHLFSTFDIG